MSRHKNLWHNLRGTNKMTHLHDKIITALSLAKAGKDKTALLSIVTNEWELTDEHMTELDLTAYFIKVWEGPYFKQQIKEGTIYDIESDDKYAVIYRGCTPSNAFKAHRLILSFRSTNVGNFVLVQKMNGVI